MCWKKNSIPILQFAKDGTFVKEWPSAKEAERQLGIFQSHICHCLKGKRKSAGGFVWKYKNKKSLIQTDQAFVIIRKLLRLSLLFKADNLLWKKNLSAKESVSGDVVAAGSEIRGVSVAHLHAILVRSFSRHRIRSGD